MGLCLACLESRPLLSSPSTPSHPEACRQLSSTSVSHICHLQLPACQEQEPGRFSCSGTVTLGKKPSSLPVRLAAWRRKSRASCQHQGGLRTEPPLSHTICSFNRLCANRIKRIFRLPGHLLCSQGMACLATLFPHRKQAAWHGALSEFCWQLLMCLLRTQDINPLLAELFTLARAMQCCWLWRGQPAHQQLGVVIASIITWGPW